MDNQNKVETKDTKVDNNEYVNLDKLTFTEQQKFVFNIKNSKYKNVFIFGEIPKDQKYKDYDNVFHFKI